MLSDTFARLADLHSRQGAFERALEDVQQGLGTAREPNYSAVTCSRPKAWSRSVTPKHSKRAVIARSAMIRKRAIELLERAMDDAGRCDRTRTPRLLRTRATSHTDTRRRLVTEEPSQARDRPDALRCRRPSQIAEKTQGQLHLQESIGDQWPPHRIADCLVWSRASTFVGCQSAPRRRSCCRASMARAPNLEIADEAGIEPNVVAATLEELVRLGAIRFDQSATVEAQRAQRAQPRVLGATRIGPIIEDNGGAQPQHPAAALYDPRDLNEEADLELERKRLILETFHRLDTTTHYQLLRVTPSADKRGIKNAYFEVVNLFHPDRYFGKKLGSFKPQAGEDFRAPDRGPRHPHPLRAARGVRCVPRLARSDSQVRPSRRERGRQVQAIQRQIEEEAQAALNSAPARLVQAGAGRAYPRARTQPITTAGIGHAAAAAVAVASGRSRSAQTRAGALARRAQPIRQLRCHDALVLADPDVAANRGPRACHGRPQAALRAADLSSAYRARRALLSNARLSLASKDPISAANALRIAASLVPDSPAISARVVEAQAEAECAALGSLPGPSRSTKSAKGAWQMPRVPTPEPRWAAPTRAPSNAPPIARSWPKAET